MPNKKMNKQGDVNARTQYTLSSGLVFGFDHFVNNDKSIFEIRMRDAS